MQDSISGFKVRGTWPEIVEHGERVVRALRESENSSEALAEFDEWRPKAHERLSEDVNEKTADQASVGEGEGEKAGQSPDEDILSAGEKLAESYENLEGEDTEEAVETWTDSISHVTRAADTAGRKAIRRLEDTVYRKVMTRFTPYYFDNELVSANICRTRDHDYIFEININERDLKDEARDHLETFESDVERWHVDTEKATEVAEHVDGVETPPEESEEFAKSTTN